jgi:hypothetical protein
VGVISTRNFGTYDVGGATNFHTVKRRKLQGTVLHNEPLSPGIKPFTSSKVYVERVYRKYYTMGFLVGSV